MVRHNKLTSNTSSGSANETTIQEQQDIISRYSHSQSSFPNLKSLQSYAFRSSTTTGTGNGTASDFANNLETHSIVNILVLPTSGTNDMAVEALKVEIAQATKNKL